MQEIKHRFRQLLTDRVGASTIEMGLICAMIVLAMMVALQGVADENTKAWTTISQKTSQAITQSTS